MSEKKSKCVFLLTPFGFAARYLLRTDILKTLKQQAEKIVILTPNADEDYFRQEFKDQNVFVEPFEVRKCDDYIKNVSSQKLFRRVRWYVMNGKSDLYAAEAHFKIYDEETTKDLWGKFKIFCIGFLMRILRRSAWLRRAFLWFEQKLHTPEFHRDLFQKYKPDIVVTTSLGNVADGFDFFLMREAKKRGAKVVTIILSWDNTSSKGMGGAIPDSIITWTDVMKRELSEYLDYPQKKIRVGGIAHFDIYHKKEKFLPKDVLFKKFGLSPDRKLILFGTKSPVGYPWHADIIEIIAQAIRENRFAHPAQLLVRLHPNHFVMRKGVMRHEEILDEYETLKNRYEHVHFNAPRIMSYRLNADMPESEMIELASLLSHSSILLTIYSTLVLEASLLDIPIVNINFEGDPKRKRHSRQSIHIDEKFVHNQRVVETGALKLSYDAEELIANIDRYLTNPALDRESRKKVVEKECGPHQGDAGEKIAQMILEA